MNRIDHIVIAAATLPQGVDYLRANLGVEIPRGGVHQTMGTHNHLMQLGNAAYLELIAINPGAELPSQPRWFGLDEAQLRQQLATRPRLITWVMNTPDIRQLAAASGFDIGTPTRLSRDNLEWEIALPDDGRLLAGGMLPYCIQWHSSPHPSRGMAELGCRLESLTIHHNRSQWLAARLEILGANSLVKVEALPDTQAPYLSALIETPRGLVTIDG